MPESNEDRLAPARCSECSRPTNEHVPGCAMAAAVSFMADLHEAGNDTEQIGAALVGALAELIAGVREAQAHAALVAASFRPDDESAAAHEARAANARLVELLARYAASADER